MGKQSMGTQYAVGVIITFIVIGVGLILTKNILSDPSWNYSYGMTADMMVLAVWGGILIPVSGIWGAIYESKQNKKKAEAAKARKHGTSETPEFPKMSGFYSSEGADSVPKKAEKDMSYRGEYPKEKED